MRGVVLDGARMISRDAAHDELSRALKLPAFYGRNLDALADCLRDARPDAVTWRDFDAAERSLGGHAVGIARVLRDAGVALTVD